MEDPRKSKRNMARWDLDRVRYNLDKPLSPLRDIRPIGDILQDVLEGLEQPPNENLLILRTAWPEIAGEQIAQHSQPEEFENFILQIHVDHPGWLPELERLKHVFLKKLQARYRELQIRQLRFYLIHR